MSEINQLQVAKLFSLIGNHNVRRIIEMMKNKEAATYAQISLCINQKSEQKGLAAYYLKKMVKVGLVRHDNETKLWYLTRAALEITSVIKQFESYCTIYDMNDVNADGKVELFVKVMNRKE